MKNSILLLVISLLLTSICGCMGGGTIGTGLTTGFGGTKNKSGIRFMLEGLVVSPSGRALANAHVTVKTSYDTVLRTTDSQGMFYAPLRIASGEFITIEINHAGKPYTEQQQISPAGARAVKQRFVIDAE